jgi:pilus assembly protein CpaF
MVSTQDVFAFQKTGVGLNGRVLGRFTATGIRPAFMERLRTSGINLPLTLFSHSVDV